MRFHLSLWLCAVLTRSLFGIECIPVLAAYAFPKENSPLIIGLAVRTGSRALHVTQIAEQFPGMNVEGTVRRTGVETLYRFAEGETLESVAVDVARAALAQAGVTPSEINGIYAATSSPTTNYIIPGFARRMGDSLGISEIPMNTVSLGCCGGMDALIAARQALIIDTLVKREATYLVITGDHSSRNLDPADFASAFLFSEGVAAIVVTNRKATNGYAVTRSNSVCVTGDPLCLVLPNQHAFPETNGFQMDGHAVLTFAAKEVVPRMTKMLGFPTFPENTTVVPHQGSRTVLNQLSTQLGQPVYSGAIADYGNTSTASYAFALHHALERADDSFVTRNVLSVAFGAELKISAVYLEPIGDPRKITDASP